MNRLPITFEEEILSKHDIDWCSNEYIKPSSINDEDGESEEEVVSLYEIAGIALEAMGGNINRIDTVIDRKVRKVRKRWYISMRFNRETGKINVEDKDFCECIFKAVNEIWGEK